MKVMKVSDVQREEATSTLFEGAVTRQALVGDKVSKLLRSSAVNFSPGAKNVFHTHAGDQILYVTEGKGIVASETEEFTVEPGTMISIPAGERHWHGATARSSFSHLSIITSGETKY